MSGFYVLFVFYALASIVSSDDNAKCPCVVQPDGKCWSYQSKYLAADIEEAVVSFPDLSMLDPPDPVDGNYPDYCVTEECKECQRVIKQRLCQIGAAKFNMTNEPKRSNVTCTRYNFKHDDDIDWCDRSKVPSSQSHSTESDANNTVTREPLTGHRVVPRSVAYSSMIGTRHVINCVARGQETDDSGFISLCAGCWAWRELPSDYFPRYINEMICMDGDLRCLSGYAKCETGFHTATVLKKVNGVLQPVNLNTAAYCECKAQVGSPVYGIVMG